MPAKTAKNSTIFYDNREIDGNYFPKCGMYSIPEMRTTDPPRDAYPTPEKLTAFGYLIT